MSKYVKTLRQTLKEMCYSPYLDDYSDDYSSIKIWKAKFDIRILGLFKVPLKSLVSQGFTPSHAATLLFPPLAQVSPLKRSTPVLTSHFLLILYK